MSSNRNDRVLREDAFAEDARRFAESGVPVTNVPGVREERMLPAKDGTPLRTQYFFPARGDRFSAIVVRSCYPQQEAWLSFCADEYNRRGFAWVVQWCRGTNGSGGSWEPNIHEREDGLSLMTHLQADDRIDSIGYLGDSYLALTGWAMADAVPDKVKGMCLGFYGCDRYLSAYQGGLFRQDVLTSWAMDNAGHAVDADYETSAAYRPQKIVDEALWGGRLEWYRDWITQTDRDAPYWNHGFWKRLWEIPERVRVPLYIREGWYDHHLGSALASWNRLPTEIRACSILEIGPWNHFFQPVIAHQDTRNAGDNALAGPMAWFDRILRSNERPHGEARKYLIGADIWLSTKNPFETQPLRFYLDAADKGLRQGPAACEASVSYRYDPDDPVHSHGVESMLKTIDSVGSLVQPAANWREDVVSFISPPLERELSVVGKIHVCLWVSSDAKDTSFTAKLMEVFPDGTAVNVRGTIGTLAYRENSGKRGGYLPGMIVQINLEMWDIAWRFKPGSQLRLDVSSSDFPQYAVHTNYPGVWSEQARTKTARQTLYTGGRYEAAIELPVAVELKKERL